MELFSPPRKKRTVTREQRLGDQDQDHEMPSRPTDDPAVEVAGRDLVEHYLSCLSERESTILRSKLAGDTMPEIARRCGFSIKEGERQLGRIRSILRAKCHS